MLDMCKVVVEEGKVFLEEEMAVLEEGGICDGCSGTVGKGDGWRAIVVRGRE